MAGPSLSVTRLVSAERAAVILVLAVIAAIRWRNDIVQTMMDPKTPFQIYHPPAAPDYTRTSAWALIPDRPPQADDPAADVFFVHPTTYDGGRDWNGPIGDAKSVRFLTHVILPNYAAPFARAGRLFAPRYRQGSVYTALTMRDDARDARAFAYGDVRRAFDDFITSLSPDRPLIVVGVEQGGTLVDRLMREELAARPGLIKRIAAVYVIDSTVLADQHTPRAILPACLTLPRRTACWLGTRRSRSTPADIREVFERSLVWGAHDELEPVNGRQILCVNPLLGAASAAQAPAAAEQRRGRRLRHRMGRSAGADDKAGLGPMRGWHPARLGPAVAVVET